MMRYLAGLALALLLAAPALAQRTVRVIDADRGVPVAGDPCNPQGDAVLRVQGSDTDYVCNKTTGLWEQEPRQVRIETAPTAGAVCDSDVIKGIRVTPAGARWRCNSDAWEPLARAGRTLINVEDYGATGTGTGQDQVAMQAAFDAASSGDTVYVPGGTYYIGDDVDLPDVDDLTVLCDPGATFRIDGAGVFALKAYCGGTCSGLTVTGCHFYDPDPAGHVGAEESHGIVVHDWDDVRLVGNACTDIGDECVDVLRADGALIQDWVVTGTPNQSDAGSALSANQSDNVAFVGNRVSSVPGGDAIGVEMTADDGAKANVAFERNTVKTTTNGAGGIKVGAGTASYARISIIDNDLTDVDGVAISVIPTSEATVDGVTIRGNRVTGGGRAMAYGGGVNRGMIQVAEGVRNGEISGNIITDVGVRDADCDGAADPYPCCAGAGDAGQCTASHNGIRIAEDGFIVSDNRITDVPRGISSDGDFIYRCDDAPTEKCGTSLHCATGTCELLEYQGNIYLGNVLSDFDATGMSPRGNDFVRGNTIRNGDKGIQVESAPTDSLVATASVQSNTISGMTERGIGVKGASIARENDILSCGIGTVLSTTQDRCSYSGTDCDGGGTCSDDGACVEFPGQGGNDDGTCDTDETCKCNAGFNAYTCTGDNTCDGTQGGTCSGGNNDGEACDCDLECSVGCTEDFMCEEGTCTTVAQVWDYENRFVGVTSTRTNSAGQDAVIREVLKHWTAGSDPDADNDEDEGFSVGSRWYNTGGEEFVLLDASDGAAVWKSTTEQGAGAETFQVLVGTGNNVIVGTGNNVVCTTCGS